MARNGLNDWNGPIHNDWNVRKWPKIGDTSFVFSGGKQPWLFSSIYCFFYFFIKNIGFFLLSFVYFAVSFDILITVRTKNDAFWQN